MREPNRQADDDRPGRVERVVARRLGVGRADRSAIFRDAAAAATDNDLPYWLVLALSGAIATLGLAMGSSAIVIGAMLVAPLLAPVLGLSLALATGDGRLAVQVGAVVALSTVAVVATAAVLTLVIPFQSVTPEIASRTRPTTLDLAVALFSGAVGALVIVARGSRLSAAIPGVAVAVALIPPLAAGGFAMGAGWRGDILYGSLLLYGANLAGIVLSGMGVFLLVGMHRPEVVEAARAWHSEAAVNGAARAVCRLPWVRELGVFGSATGRGVLVLAFAASLAVPLTAALRQSAREVRVRRAVSIAEKMLEVPGQTSILGRTLSFGDSTTRVHLRVATATWVDDERRAAFERAAASRAREPVRLMLEQLPATAGAIDDLVGILPDRNPGPAPDNQLPLPELTERTRSLLHAALSGTPFPAGVRPIGATLVVPPHGRPVAEVGYLARAALHPQAEDVLARGLGRAVGDPTLQVGFVLIQDDVWPLHPASAGAPPDSIRALLRRFPALAVELLVGEAADSAAARDLTAALTDNGDSADRVRVRRVDGGQVQARLFVPTGARREE